VVVSERIDPTQYPLPPFWSALRRVFYPKAKAVVVQTPVVRRWAEGFLRADSVHVIPNPVMAPSIAPEQVRELPSALELRQARRRVLAVGRLHAQKGFDLLIRAFAACRAEHPDWDLVILGEGQERANLESLAAELGVSSAVSLPGRVACPVTVMHRSDLFVLSSRYEGFPNVLLEAMAAGLPVIAADCPSGPSHIVRDGVDGLLVPPEDVDALARAMGALMGDPKRREALRARAGEVTERFAVDRIMAGWGQLLRSVVATTQGREG
jgi:glycosyltransferase involved in cell wall biosynthesis